jgi:cyclopropane fatty-acyl-phospholipid synthase-like methyltransferase
MTDNSRKAPQELQALHGEDYVREFEKSQDVNRVIRLLQYCALPSNAQIADFGCGNGLLMAALASRVGSYHGVDFSQPFIQAASRRQQRLGIRNASLYCQDITQFCAEHKHQFDAAFALDFSEHVYDDDWLSILRNIHSSLKAGGKFYLHTPNREFVVEALKANGIMQQFPEHIAVRTPKHNSDLLRQAGFSTINLRLLPHYNILKVLHWFSWLPWVGRYLKARIFIEATV